MKALLLALCLLAPSLALAQAPVIQISGANFRPLPLAYPRPLADAGAQANAAAFDEAMLFDLTASGLFQVLDRKGFLADPREGLTAASIQFSRWADVGADSLVKVQLTGVPGAALRGELRLFNVGSGREDFKVTQTAAQPRALAHQLADALYRHLTREPGPFGARLAFVRKSGANRDILVADWDGHAARPVTQGGINLLPAVGPAGEVAFTTYRSGQPDLYVSRGGAPVPLVQARQMVTGVSFSPDGSRIAYSLAEGEGAQLYVANADGSGRKRVTDGFGINSSPSWAPDGKRLAFVSNRGGSPQVYVMNLDGSGVRRLTFRGNYNQTPDWSPRGDLIVFTARDERNAFDLFTVNVQTGAIVRLTQDQGNNEEPSFSPNGRLIVFSSTRTGPPRLYVMTADGNNQVALPMERGNHLTPDWGPAAASR